MDQQFYAHQQKDFLLKDNLLFLNITPANSLETISVFVVPAQKCQATIDGVTGVPVTRDGTAL